VGNSTSFFARTAEDLHYVIQDAADWLESQHASLQEHNDCKKIRQSFKKLRKLNGPPFRDGP
jgi:hypothetical protein